jgi:hypothetical protein
VNLSASSCGIAVRYLIQTTASMIGKELCDNEHDIVFSSQPSREASIAFQVYIFSSNLTSVRIVVFFLIGSGNPPSTLTFR